MMRITRIEPVTKTKYRVSVDEQFAFVVYKGELSRFHLKEECELTEDTYAKIKEVLLKRARAFRSGSNPGASSQKTLGLCLYRSERKAENIWIFGAERISLRRYPSSNTSLRLECLTYL